MSTSYDDGDFTRNDPFNDFVNTSMSVVESVLSMRFHHGLIDSSLNEMARHLIHWNDEELETLIQKNIVHLYDSIASIIRLVIAFLITLTSATLNVYYLTVTVLDEDDRTKNET